jgi:multiple sugar transport system permease protein
MSGRFGRDAGVEPPPRADLGAAPSPMTGAPPPIPTNTARREPDEATRARSRRTRRKGVGARARGAIAPVGWIGPSYLVFIAIMAFPALWNIVESLYTSSYGKNVFVGLGNYRGIFASGQFYSSLWLTVYWTAGVFAGQFLLGLALAVFFRRDLWIGRFIKPLLIIPWALPGIVVATAWTFMYSETGLINDVLGLFMKTPPAWLSDPHLVMPAVIVAGIWKGTPFFFLMLLAGLQSVPRELIEAAQLDGAGRLRILVSVELPYIRNIVAVTSLLSLIWTMNYFDGIYLMTQGGPLNKTQTLPIWIYNTAFGSFNLNKASALAVVLMLIVLALSVPALRRTERTS